MHKQKREERGREEAKEEGEKEGERKGGNVREIEGDLRTSVLLL